jgi:hypothetical protein
MNSRKGLRIVCLVAAGLAGAGSCVAQGTLRPDLAGVTRGGEWKAFNRLPVVIHEEGKVIARLDERAGDGALWLEGTVFETGTIEVELRGKNQPQRSFLGVAFHAADDRTFEAVYFRPFNFRSEEPVRRGHSVQYISHPEYTWQKLRTEQSGKFEHALDPAPDPDGWFRARVEVTSARVRVFVNGAAQSCLDVPRLTDLSVGRVGLWVGNGSGGDFAHLVIVADRRR